MVSKAIATFRFDYHLPEHLIAQRPLPERTGSRLLHLNQAGLTHGVLDLAATSGGRLADFKRYSGGEGPFTGSERSRRYGRDFAGARVAA